MNVTVLGAGAWGTALALHLGKAGHSIRLWGHDASHLQALGSSGRNDRYHEV